MILAIFGLVLVLVQGGLEIKGQDYKLHRVNGVLRVIDEFGLSILIVRVLYFFMVLKAKTRIGARIKGKE